MVPSSPLPTLRSIRSCVPLCAPCGLVSQHSNRVFVARWQAFSSIGKIPRFGTKKSSPLPTWISSIQRRDTSKHPSVVNAHWECNIQCITDEQLLWDAILGCPTCNANDSSFWKGAGTRMNRTLPPELSSVGASNRDEILWWTTVTLLGQSPGTPEQLDGPRWLHHFPCAWVGWECGRQVGLPHWVSWTDVITMITERNPTVLFWCECLLFCCECLL